MRRFLTTACVLLAVAAPISGRADELPVTIGDLRSPESAAWHAGSSAWFVSNMGGISFDLGPDAGDGFISRIPRTGAVEPRWIGGLERPRGVSAGPNHLFVALGPGATTPAGSIAVIDVAAKQVKWRIPIPGANGDLNDVLYDAATGAVYASAPNVDTIFRIAQPLSISPLNRVAEVFVQSSELTQPNGLAIEDGFLVSAGLGLSSLTGFGGRLVRIDLITRQISPITDNGMGLLDGLVKDGDDYLVTEYATGNLYRIARDGTQSLIYKLAPGAADLGIDPVRRVIMVPETLLNAAVVLPVLL